MTRSTPIVSAAVSPVSVAVPASVCPRGASAGTAGPELPPSGPATQTPPGVGRRRAGQRAALGGSNSPEGPAISPGRGPGPGRGDPGFTPPRPGQGTSRSWTLELPAGMQLLSLNERSHWAVRHFKTQALKQAAWALARQAKIPRLERASITVEYQPPDRRHRDAENTCAASGKACVDGLVAAGVLEDDECPRYVAGIYCTIGERYPKGRLVVTITEVAELAGIRGTG